MFSEKRRNTVTSPNEISSIDVDPPAHVVIDFLDIMACQELLNLIENQQNIQDTFVEEQLQHTERLEHNRERP